MGPAFVQTPIGMQGLLPSFNLVKNLQLKDKAIRRERCGSTLKLLPQQQIGPYEESSMWHELDLPRRPAD